MSQSAPFLQGLKYFVVDGNYSIGRLMRDFGAECSSGINQADIILYSGGADVSPALYGQKKHERTSCQPERDDYEVRVFNATRGKLQVGICRGGQLLNVLNGGELWQDVNNHALRGTHPARYRQPDGSITTVEVNSTHHQMMIPNNRTGIVWVSAGETTFKEQQHDYTSTRMFSAGHDEDVEVVWYPGRRSLCFQPHPEYTHHNVKQTVDLFETCLKRALQWQG